MLMIAFKITVILIITDRIHRLNWCFFSFYGFFFYFWCYQVVIRVFGWLPNFFFIISFLRLWFWLHRMNGSSNNNEIVLVIFFNTQLNVSVILSIFHFFQPLMSMSAFNICLREALLSFFRHPPGSGLFSTTPTS